jgi:hypothetical protein
MNQADDNRQATDAEVSAAYNALAAEQPPPELDRKILRMARQGAQGAARSNWLTSRIRPLAFFVTAGLALALVVQLSNTPYFDLPGPVTPAQDETGAESVDTFRDAARDTAEQLRQIEAEASASSSTNDAAMVSAATRELPAADSRLPDDDRCPDADRADSATWWECIRNLEKRGLSQAAEAELQLLLKTYPQFSAPAQ